MSTTARFDAGVDHETVAPGAPSHAEAPAHGRTAPAHGHAAPATGHAFKDILRDALCLLSYAIEMGIVVEAEVAQRIVAAERVGDAVWDEASAGQLISDITKLGALMHPVTAVTLRASEQQAHATIRNYRWIAIALALFIVPWSILSFIFAGINTTISTEIASANQLVVTLHAQLEGAPSGSGGGSQVAPIDALPDLQQLAATIRSIYRHSHTLTWFVPTEEPDPVTRKTRLELDIDLSRQVDRLQANLDELTAAYQQIRSYAKSTQDDGAAVYGAVTTCLLPIFYAVLGACAYLLRTFSGQLATRTFAPSYSTSARFVIAAIGGGVVGLFNNFGTGQVAALSPLAIAFVAGYAVDVFFSLVDGAVKGVPPPRNG